MIGFITDEAVFLKVDAGLWAEQSTKEDNTHTHTRLTALFWDYPGEPVPER